MANHGNHLMMSWARKMIEDDIAGRQMCDREFAAADRDGSGDLEIPEVVYLVSKICKSMSIKMPQREKVVQLVKVCDKSKDGSLQLTEFRAAFKSVLKSCVHEAEAEGATTTTTTTTTTAAEVAGATTTSTTTTTIHEIEIPQPTPEAEPQPDNNNYNNSNNNNNNNNKNINNQPAREQLELSFSRSLVLLKVIF
ncbi:unnamed protein product [Polarella glacialis]|uniref:EF-hand domain-containing protein n=1 Tax=Polarella glacialis TaxID=89957 RepID=A0A813HP74_POLGL|nr:unnamed protein product [Polarella glacialis]